MFRQVVLYRGSRRVSFHDSGKTLGSLIAVWKGIDANVIYFKVGAEGICWVQTQIMAVLHISTLENSFLPMVFTCVFSGVIISIKLFLSSALPERAGNNQRKHSGG